MTLHTLFVYGTLKRSFSNHHLLENSQFLGTGYTRTKYAMYTSGIPFVVKAEEVSHIYGELYQVDDTTLKQLDWLEGHPNWYCREQVEIVSASEQTVSAWLYFYPEKNGRLNITGVY